LVTVTDLPVVENLRLAGCMGPSRPLIVPRLRIFVTQISGDVKSKSDFFFHVNVTIGVLSFLVHQKVELNIFCGLPLIFNTSCGPW